MSTPVVLTYLELFGGLTYLLLAGDLLVRGSVALARRAGIPPVVVGLSIVAFGTSAPELCISVGSAFRGHGDVAMGNVVGSNIANVLLVLGLPALIAPTVCDRRTVGTDCLLMAGASLLFLGLCSRGVLGTAEGVLLFALIVAILVRTARRTARDPAAEEAAEEELERVLGLPSRGWMIALFLGLGVAGLPLGADLMVDGAVQLAGSWGVSQAVIGLTVIAVGTSLPELATTVVAALHRHSEVALGNVLGSNLFNLLAIMGFTAMVAPGGVPVPAGFLRYDLPVMMGVALLPVWFAWGRGSIGRWSGATLVAAYSLYLASLFLGPGAVATATAAAGG